MHPLATMRAGRTKLRPDEWKGGDIPWLIEVIAPFGATEEILDDMAKVVFKGKAFHFHTVKDGKRVVETRG